MLKPNQKKKEKFCSVYLLMKYIYVLKTIYPLTSSQHP